MKALKEAQEKLVAKNAKLAEVYKEAGDTVDLSLVKSSGFDQLVDTKSRVQRINEMDAEINDIAVEVESLQTVEKSRKETADREKMIKTAVNSVIHPEAKGHDGVIINPRTGQPVNTKSIGQQFIESAAYKDGVVCKEKEVSLDGGLESKTTFSTTAGWAPEDLRVAGFVPDAQRPVQVMIANIIPTIPTTQSSYVYMEETTFTNAAAETAEAGTFPEATLALTEQSVPIRKIAVNIPVTDEQLEDVAGISAYLNARLGFMIDQRKDLQVLVGNGTAPNLRGINNVVGIQTQALGGDNRPDAIYKAMDLVRVTGQAFPSAYVTHPNDWQPIRLLQTADGVYIWGAPSDAGPERIWGLPVVQAQAQTEGTGLVADFENYILIVNKAGLDMKITNSNEDDFINGIQRIRATIRCAVVVTRPAAVCQVTGI
jgi:HK97 family phage major capsid protein